MRNCEFSCHTSQGDGNVIFSLEIDMGASSNLTRQARSCKEHGTIPLKDYSGSICPFRYSVAIDQLKNNGIFMQRKGRIQHIRTSFLKTCPHPEVWFLLQFSQLRLYLKPHYFYLGDSQTVVNMPWSGRQPYLMHTCAVLSP